jgi:long-chain acyl-CoA synthetase
MLERNLVRTVAESLRTHWNLSALTDYRGATLTYAQVAARIAQLHHLFRAVGVGKGDKVAVVGRNSAHWCVTYLAAVTHGAVIVPVLPDFTGDEIHHVVNHSEARLVFVSESIYDRIDDHRLKHILAILDLADFRPLHCRTEETRKLVEAAAASFTVPRPAPEPPADLGFADVGNAELAAIIYTSGTTGFSKGVMLSHNCLAANVQVYWDNLEIHPGEPVLCLLPLAHAFGCSFEFLCSFTRGVHVTLLDRLPTPKVLLRAFAEVRPRLILAVPLILEKIYKNRIKPVLQGRRIQLLLRTPLLRRMVEKRILAQLSEVFGGNFYEVVIGGAALNREVEDFLLRIGFPFTCGYGMTECGPLISYTAHHKGRSPYSVGRPIPFLAVRVDSADPQRQVGEILLRGENVMDGYYKDPEATAEALDPDGWLHTGDLGVVDTNGCIVLKGRSKNVILTATGQNVYPEEIESRLNNLPYVEESLVVDANGRLVALVYPDMEKVDADGLGEPALKAILEENRERLNAMLPAYSQVARIRINPEEFEKTATKKIRRTLYTMASHEARA